jgi:cyclophilin family peptidyl-prolyl cis-trans isomerase
VVLRFYKNVAIEHRANFMKLAKAGFYDRTRIHRIVPGALIQLGDPLSKDRDLSRWGQGGPDYIMDNEFSLITHRRGTVSMYRGPGRPKSHGSQFQILLKDQPNLDFVQTPFAEVVSGIEIIDAISRQSTNQYQAPVEDVFLNGISLPPSAR